MFGWAGFLHVWLTSVKEGFVIEVIYRTTQVYTKKWNVVNMETKTFKFSLQLRFRFVFKNNEKNTS